MDSARRKAYIDPDRLLPWLCLLFVVVGLASRAIRFPQADGDQLWQRWLGERILREHAIPRVLGSETFSAPGAPWTPHEWLFSVGFAFGADHGLPWLMPVVCALAAGVALAAIIVRSRRRGVSPALSSVAVLLCGLAMIQSFGARAQVVGWAGIATVLWLLETEGPWAWATVPVTLVWANLHASAFLAPAVALLFAVASALRDRRWSPDVTRFSMISAACAAMTLATPLGLALPRYAFGLITSPIRQVISEWHATSTDSFSFALGALPLVLALAVFGVRASLRDRLIVVAFTMLLFTAVRNVPVFALATAPIAAAAVSSKRNSALPRTPARTMVGWTTVTAVSFAVITVATRLWRAAPFAEQVLPLHSARVLLAEARTPPRVFCEDFAWCSIFLLERQPARFFMDGRCDPYPVDVWRKYLRVLNGNPGWAQVLDEYRVDAVLVRRESALDSLLAESSRTWSSIASDQLSRLYVRSPIVHATLRLTNASVVVKRTGP
jgi:hypothetical protein